jgi:hypothetical protein
MIPFLAINAKGGESMSPKQKGQHHHLFLKLFSIGNFKLVSEAPQSSRTKDVLAERPFPRKILTQRGFAPSSPRGRVGLCRGKADPSLMVRLCM